MAEAAARPGRWRVAAVGWAGAALGLAGCGAPPSLATGPATFVLARGPASSLPAGSATEALPVAPREEGAAHGPVAGPGQPAPAAPGLDVGGWGGRRAADAAGVVTPWRLRIITAGTERPAPGAWILPLNGDWSEADAQGRVALPGPWPPDTTLAVGAPGHATRVAPRTPGADEVTITLTPTGGRPTAAPPPTRRVALTGLVTSPAGTPLPGLRVSLHGEAVGATLPVQTDAAGRYELLADLVEGAATATLLTIDPAGAWLGALPDAPVAAAGPDADATRTLPVLEALATSHPVTVAVQGPGSLPSPRTVVTVSLAGARAVELPGTTGARLAPLPGARFGVRARAVSADGLTASHLAQDNLPVDWSAVGTTWQATLLEPPEPDAVPAWASGQVLQCQPVAGARAYAAMLEAGAPHAGLPWLATGVMPSLPLLGLPAALPATDMRASLLAWDGVGEVADLDPTTPTGPASARVRWSVRRWVVPAGP